LGMGLIFITVKLFSKYRLATAKTEPPKLPRLFVDLESAEKVFDLPVVRIICTDLPQYFAIVSRVRLQSQTLGAAGGILSSTVVPQAQLVFPQDAIVKPIRVGLQVVMIIIINVYG